MKGSKIRISNLTLHVREVNLYLPPKTKRGTLLKQSRQCCFLSVLKGLAIRCVPVTQGRDFTAAIYKIRNRTGLDTAKLPSGQIGYVMDTDLSTIYIFLKQCIPLLKAVKPKG